MGWHILAICMHLMAVSAGKIKRLLINVPPRHCKSLLVNVFWPAWSFANGDRRAWLFVSGGQDLALRDSVKFRRLIESEKFRRWFPDCQIQPDQNTKSKIDIEGGGVREITSANSRVTGKGGDFIIIDDLHDARAGGDEIRRDVQWRKDVLSTRGNDPDETAWVIIMQRLHEEDLSGWTLATYGLFELEGNPFGYVHLNLPWHYDEERRCVTPIWEDPRIVNGELLWPERFKERHYAELLASLGPLGAAGQLEQNPHPADGTEFRKEWFEYRYTRLLAIDVERWIISVDTAFKGKETSDWCVFQLIAKVGALRYIVDQHREKHAYPELRQAFLDWRKLWVSRGIVAETVIIEDKANGTALCDELETVVEGIWRYDPGKDSKEVRYRAASPQWHGGQVLLPKEDEHGRPPVLVNTAGQEIELDPSFVPLLRKECLAIPTGKHDDQADAITQALLVILKQYGIEFEAGPETDEADVTDWSSVYG